MHFVRPIPITQKLTNFFSFACGQVHVKLADLFAKYEGSTQRKIDEWPYQLVCVIKKHPFTCTHAHAISKERIVE